MKLPAVLKHRPIVVSENDEQVDGRFARNTDAKGLSLGLAQRSDRGKAANSPKVWRSAGEKWSFVHSILPVLGAFREAYRYEHFYDPQEPVLDRVGLQGGAMTVAICMDNGRINEDIKLFNQTLDADDEMIGERLRPLSQILKDMGY